MKFQQELIDSVKMNGGYGRKVSHPQLKGISDLILQMPGHSMVQVECKDMGTLKSGFDVASGITEHQKKHVEALNQAAGGLVAFYAFNVIIGVTDHCVFLKHYKERFTYADMWNWSSTRSVNANHKQWPFLPEVWANLGVLRIAASS